MKEIYLTQGKTAIVDDDDFDHLNQFKWFYHNGYAVRHGCRKGAKRDTQIRMHREILNNPQGIVDHINGNRSDNRKSNLRISDKTRNMANSRIRGGISKFKGVALVKNRLHSSTQWVARIGVFGYRFHIGFYKTEDEAAIAYNKIASEWFGKHARLNNV